jgi:hypothetical protein
MDPLGGIGGAVFVTRTQKYARTFACEFKRRRVANPATGRRHQRHPIFDSQVH